MNRQFRKILALVVAIAMLVPMAAFAEGDGTSIFKQKTIKNIVVDMGGGQTLDLTGLDLSVIGAGDIGLEKLMAGITVSTPAENSSSLTLEVGRNELYALVANQLLKLNYADIGKIVKNISGEEIPEKDVAQITDAIGKVFDVLNGDFEIPDSVFEGLANVVSFAAKYTEKFTDIAASVPTTEESAIFTINGEEYIGVKKSTFVDAAKFSEMMQAVSEMYQDEAIMNMLNGLFSSMNVEDENGNPVDFAEMYKNVISSFAGITMPAGMTINSYEMKDGNEFANSVVVERAEMDMSDYYAAIINELPADETDKAEAQKALDKMSKMSFDINTSVIGEMDEEDSMISNITYFGLSQNYYLGDSTDAFMACNAYADMPGDGTGVLNGKWTMTLAPELTGDETAHSIEMEFNYDFSDTEIDGVDTKTGALTFSAAADGNSLGNVGLTYSNAGDDATAETKVAATITADGETHTLFDLTINCAHSDDEATLTEAHAADFNIRVMDDMYGVTGTIETLNRPATAADFLSANADAATDLVTLETQEDVDNLGLNIQMGLYELLGGLMQVPGVAQLMAVTAEGMSPAA